MMMTEPAARKLRVFITAVGHQLLSHLKHVGHDGPSALDVDAAGAIVLPDRRLAAGRTLQLTGALSNKIPIAVCHCTAAGCAL